MTFFARLSSSSFDYLFPGARPLLSPDPFNGFPTPYLGDAPEAYLGLGSGSLPLAVDITTPTDGTTLDINTAATISGNVTSDADRVELYLDYPATPLGTAVKVGGTYSIGLTPNLLQHGAHTLTAVAYRGAEVLQSSSVSISISAVAARGTWSTNTGVYYDPRLISAAIGSDVTSLAPLEGTGTLAVGSGATANPKLAVGKGLRNAISFTTAGTARLLTSLATAAGDDQPITVIWRQIIGSVATAMRPWAFGNTAQASNDFLEYTWGTTHQVIRDAIAETSVTKTLASVPRNTTAWQTIAFVFYGTSFDVYIDGVKQINSVDPTSPGQWPCDTIALTCNQLSLGAWARSSNNGFFEGLIGPFACRRGALTQSEIQAIGAAWDASDLAAPVGAPLFTFGDSTTVGDPNGGWRKFLSQHIVNNSLAIDLVGPNSNGGFTDNQHGGFGGKSMSQLQGLISSYLGSGKPFAGTKLGILLTGTNDVDVGGMTLGTLQTNYTNLVTAYDAALVSGFATARMVLSEILPYAPASSGGNDTAVSLIASFNSWLAATFIPSWNASNPSRKAFLWKPYAALGSTWSSGSFTDTRHPNASGYQTMVQNGTNGLLVASDGTQTLTAFLPTL